MNNRFELTLNGPEFIQSAVEISQKVSLGTISRLYAYNVTADSVSALKSALSKLRGYFTKDGTVIISTPQTLPSNTASVLQLSAGVPVNISTPSFQGIMSSVKTNAAAMSQMQMSEQQQAQTIQTQIAADAQKQQAQRWKIMKDTQTKIFQIHQDVTVNKARTSNIASRRWNAYIRF